MYLAKQKIFQLAYHASTEDELSCDSYRGELSCESQVVCIMYNLQRQIIIT